MRNSRLLFLLALALCVFSCEVYPDGGFPREITFPKEGGEKTVVGEEQITRLYIYEDIYERAVAIDDLSDNELKISYDWLTVNSPFNGNYFSDLTISVEPNTANEQRVLFVGIPTGWDYTKTIYIGIKQNN